MIFMNWTEYFKVLSEPSRLRLLNLLSNAELNVNELIEMMNMQQSRVSKHLKVLKEAGFVHERRDGTWRFYTFNSDLLPQEIIRLLTDIWKDDAYVKEKEKIQFIIEKRKLFAENFFHNSHAMGLGSFYSFENLATAFSLLIPAGSRILDAGYGQGKLLWCLSQNPAVELYGIDIYKNGLDKTVFKDSEPNLKERIRLIKSDIAKTDFQDSFFDVVFANMVLHHIHALEPALCEISRILKRGGKLVVIDFFKHSQEHMREKYKDFWLGFSVEEMENLGKKAGLALTVHYLVPHQNQGEEEIPDNLILMFEKE